MNPKKVTVYISLVLLSILIGVVVSSNLYEIEVVDSEYPIYSIIIYNQPYKLDDLSPWLINAHNGEIWHQAYVRCGFGGGVRAPGTYLSHDYSISHPENIGNLTIVKQLIEIGGNVQVVEREIETVSGPPFSTKWMIRIPEKIPATYRYGFVVYDPQGFILAKMVSDVYVPEQSLNASFYLEPSLVTNEETIQLVIENHGPTDLSYGVMYDMEKLVDGEWTPAPARNAWILPLLLLPANHIDKTGIMVKGCDSGTYRILKKVHAEGTNITHEAQAGFSVERSEYQDTGKEPPFGFRYTWSFSHASRKSPDRPMLHLTNLGARKLYFDTGYSVYSIDDGVINLVFSEVFNETSMIEWGETFDLVIGKEILSEGDYIFEIDLGIEGTTYRETFTHNFERD